MCGELTHRFLLWSQVLLTAESPLSHRCLDTPPEELQACSPEVTKSLRQSVYNSFTGQSQDPRQLALPEKPWHCFLLWKGLTHQCRTAKKHWFLGTGGRGYGLWRSHTYESLNCTCLWLPVAFFPKGFKWDSIWILLTSKVSPAEGSQEMRSLCFSFQNKSHWDEARVSSLSVTSIIKVPCLNPDFHQAIKWGWQTLVSFTFESLSFMAHTSKDDQGLRHKGQSHSLSHSWETLRQDNK